MGQIFISRQELEHRQLPLVCMKCGCKGARWLRRDFRWQSAKDIARSHTSVSLERNWNVSSRDPGGWTMRQYGTTYYTVTTCSVPICDEHRNHWVRPFIFTGIGMGISVLALLIGVPIMFALMPKGGPGMFLGTIPIFLVFIGGMVFAVVGAITAGSKCVRITNGNKKKGWTFSGVDDKFISALKKYRKNPPPKPARPPDNEDEEDEDDEEERPARSRGRGRPRRRYEEEDEEDEDEDDEDEEEDDDEDDRPRRRRR
jgi:hypothetical protein